MAGYSLFQKPSVEKDLHKIPSSVVEKITRKILSLSNEPLPPQSVKLAGSDHYYRLRVGDYRIIYEVDRSQRRITVQYVRHRREVYRSF